MKKLFHYLAATVCLTGSLVCQAGDFNQREDVQAFIKDLAQREHFREDELQAAMGSAQVLPQVIRLIRPPENPGVRSWQRYRPRFVNQARIKAGVDFWRWHEKTLAEAETRTGVPAEIIVGIIGVETVYGRNMGSFQALSALSTLAFDYPPRAALFRHELEELFLLARDQGHDVREYKGSYAGAIGLPQFLPSKIRSLGVDGDGDGIVDVRGNAEDAIMSVANYLKSYGWKKDAPIVMPARVEDPVRAQGLVDVGIVPKLDAALLLQGGVHSDLKLHAHEPVALIDFVSPGAPTEYWLGFQNFYVITRYNHSSFYAMSVHDLAQAVKYAFEHPAPAKTQPAAKSSGVAARPIHRKQVHGGRPQHQQTR